MASHDIIGGPLGLGALLVIFSGYLDNMVLKCFLYNINMVVSSQYVAISVMSQEKPLDNII